MSRPSGIDAHPEQLRDPIPRSLGSTPSERHLARLAEGTFLNLWSYPNPYRAQKVRGGSDGKELCDLLVVCDPHIVLFSEKRIGWPDKPLDVAWPRWFRKAVSAAADQLRGAERWIVDFPDRIFLDPSCTVPLPLVLPPSIRRRLHRVVVSGGAAAACKDHFRGGSGSFLIKPDVVADDHCNVACPRYMPFAVGDIEPSGDFVHVFDEVALEIVMSELDTISDFTDYLDKRSAFIRSGKLTIAHGEEDMLADYATHINESGEHDFVPPSGQTWDDVEGIGIGSSYSSFTTNPQYIAKKEADKVSYVWDRLIETFTDNMLGGTSIVLAGHSYSLTNSELAVRFMALERRFRRRSYGTAILGALETGEHHDVFFRAMISREGATGCETGFFFMTLKYLDWMEKERGYEAYRQARTKYLEVYAKALLTKHPYLQRVIGIATEPANQGRGSSEDCIYAEQADWSDEDRENIQADCDALGIMRSLVPKNYHADEFPEAAAPLRRPSARGNRKQRRAEAAAARRRGRRT